MYLMRCMHHVPGKAIMSLMSDALEMHGHAWGSRATRHVTAPEPSRTRRRVRRHRTCGDTGALSGNGPGVSVTWRHQSLPAQGVDLEPQDTWRLRSPLLVGDGLGASGHVATPEPFSGGWCARCLRARGDIEALSWRVVRFVPWGTW
jgi:hypothetical protein